MTYGLISGVFTDDPYNFKLLGLFYSALLFMLSFDISKLCILPYINEFIHDENISIHRCSVEEENMFLRCILVVYMEYPLNRIGAHIALNHKLVSPFARSR